MTRSQSASIVAFTCDPLLRAVVNLFACEPEATWTSEHGETLVIPIRSGKAFVPVKDEGEIVSMPKRAVQGVLML